ncbi:MAG: helix-turn-helix transcriptional regulator [Clostridia bacterium]|nr:helix-turn-helix transcriptional regulator [Clostridia bacterium]
MRLKSLREYKDITQSQLASFLHIKQNTYSQYENGQRGVPVEVLIELSSFFETSVDYILELTDEQKPYPRRKEKGKK